jgi:putative methyltransferase (TIGR04325 family)
MSKRSSSKRVLKAVLKKLRLQALRPQVSGYENTTLVNEVIRKTLLRRDEIDSQKYINLSELRSLAGFMLANLKEGSRVLDFGGGAGTHFDSLQQLYPQKSLEYFVIETEMMSSLAAKARLADTNLHFMSFNHLFDFKPNFQVLIANSSLQYMEKPLNVLSTLMDLFPEYVYITRCPLTQSKDQLRINQISNLSDNGPSVKS